MLSDDLRDEASRLSKWPHFPEKVKLMNRAADELDRRAATIRRLQHIIDAKNGATCTD